MQVEWHNAQESTPHLGSYSWSGLCWVSDGIDIVTVGRYDRSKKTWWTFGKCLVTKWAYADIPKAKN